MTSSTDNVKIGVCALTFDGADLGYTKGGVDVSITTETYTVTVDQFGTTAINDYVIGINCTVTTPLAETSLENLAAVMPAAALVIDGATSSKKKVQVTTGVGTNLIDSAGELILHPVALAADNVTEDFILPNAASTGQISFAYSLDAERVFNTVWKAYPDVNNILFVYGDKTAAA
jgi:hypothetical protein